MQTVYHTQLGKGNRIGLPASVCQKYGLEPGSKITVVADENGLHLTTAEQALQIAQDLFTKHLQSGEVPSEELIRQRRAEAERV